MIECFFTIPILLAADPGLSGALTQLLFFFAPLFAIWYFLVLAPQSKQRKKVQEMLANLKSGDRVVTNGGIYGTILGFRDRDSTVQVQIAPQVKVDVQRSSITGVVNEGEEPGKTEPPPKGKGKGN